MPGDRSGSTAESSSGSRRQALQERALDDLIARARAGDIKALDRLVEALSDQLWAELSSRRRSNRTGPAHGSSDLVQDTIVRMREQFHKFERETFADLKQWARTVLYRRRQEWARNHHARNAERHKLAIWNELRARINTDRNGSERDDPAEHQEEMTRAFALYEALKEHERFVIELRLFQGLNYREIASLTGTKEDAPRQAFNRAMAKLKTEYQRDGDC